MNSIRPMYHFTHRKGYVHYHNHSYWFLYIDTNGVLQIDEWSMHALHNNQMRFYKFWNALPHYDQYDFATVHNDATLILYKRFNPSDWNTDHLSFNLYDNPPVIDYHLSSSPPDDDYLYRINNFATSSDYPPAPPPGGAALADGAESILPTPPSPPVLLAALAAPYHHVTPLQTMNLWNTHNQHEDPHTTHTYTIYDETQPTQTGYGPSSMESARLLLTALLLPDRTPISPIKNYSVKPKSPMKRVADLVIQDALKQELCCAISLNPLTVENAVCVAPCYHVFEKESISKWLTTSSTCPECRETCSI